jgi:hypothetical protein
LLERLLVHPELLLEKFLIHSGDVARKVVDIDVAREVVGILGNFC